MESHRWRMLLAIRKKGEVRSGKDKKNMIFFQNHVRYGTKRAMSLMMWIEVASNSCISVAASAFDNTLEHSAAFRGARFFLCGKLPIICCVSLQLYHSFFIFRVKKACQNKA